MSSEKRFIRECLRIYLSGNGSLRSCYKKIDLQKLGIIIKRHELEGFFFDLFTNGYFKDLDLPGSEIDHWKKVAGRNSLANTVNDNEVLALVRILKDNEIGYILMKGLSTRYRCYDADYIRSSSDIDIFIDRDDYSKVKSILLSRGYEIPFDSYISKYDVRISLEEYEKRAYGMMFLKKQGKLRLLVDLQWDFVLSEKESVFHCLYRVDSFYRTGDAVEIKVGQNAIKVFSLEAAFVNLAFHFAFIHGFMGAKFFLDICQFLKRNYEKMDFKIINSAASSDMKKILGLVLMLAYEYGSIPDSASIKSNIFCVDRFLPLEYRFYRSMILKSSDLFNRILLRLIRILLPYRIGDRLRVANYLFFNTDSIGQRLETDRRQRGFLLPFSLLRMFIVDAIRKKGSRYKGS